MTELEDISLGVRARCGRAECFVFVFFLLYFRSMVGREVDGQHVLSEYFVFYIFDRWSIVKLTGLCGWSLGWLISRSWASAGGPGPLLGPMLAILGCSWASTGGPGPLLGPLCAVLGRSWGLSWRSGTEKREEHGYLENMFISRAGARSAAWGSVLSRS